MSFFVLLRKVIFVLATHGINNEKIRQLGGQDISNIVGRYLTVSLKRTIFMFTVFYAQVLELF